MANPRKFSEKIALHNQKQAEETAEFEKIMKEVSDATSKSLINNDDIKTHGSPRERTRSAVGPIRARPADKRTDTSPYSSYLSPPPDTGWRRTHSDSSLHTSSQEQITAQRRGTIDTDVPFADPLRRNTSATHIGKTNFEMSSRIPGISLMSSAPENAHNTMGKNTGSLPDLTCCHFPPPLDTPLDLEDRVPPYQPGANPGNGFSAIYQNARISKLPFVGSPPHEAPGPPQPQTPPQYMNQVNFNNGIAPQFVYQVSPLQPTSPQPTPAQQNCFNTYRTPVSRPSPQPSPSLSVRFGVGSPRSGSPQSPSSPGSVSSSMSPFPDHQSYNVQASALQHHFENISMDDNCSQLPQEPSYFSTSPSHQGPYPSNINTLNAQTAPNTPSSIPDIVLTDFSNSEELANNLGVSSLESDLFPTDDCLREGLDPIDLEGLQMLTDSDLIADPATEDHFRLDRL